MSSRLSHRGPDDHGIYVSANAGLAHRRLSIIDRTQAGHCPMPNEDGQLWITFNGEIYNYRELMPDLLARGHQFRSHCDTEVILHAFEEYGERCVDRFNGMFAFAIWDEHRKQLFCARDRSGVKPLYYTSSGCDFAFASEPKALLTLPWITNEPDERAIFDYLVHGVIDHSERTFFSAIKSLPAAHTLTIDRSGIHIRRYWTIPTPDPQQLTAPASPRQTTQWRDEFQQLLLDSVRLRLRSDVAVGSCLSGGLDSSTLVCLVNGLLFPEGGNHLEERWHLRGERQKTFSACFNDAEIDERPYIERVINRTGAASYRTFPNGEDLFNVLSSVIWHQDEPFLSTGIVAQWYVMQLARQHGVTVLIDGQGADELLCGYPGYFGPYFADLLATGRWGDLAREMTLFNRNYRHRWGNAQRMLAQAMRARHAWLHPRLRSRIDPYRSLPSWLEPTFAHGMALQPAPLGFTPDSSGYLPAVMKWQFAHGSLPSLLRYEDRNSMAFGIEARVPFLDYRLVEYVFRAPNALRISGGVGKRVLRDVTRGLIPEAVRTRRDKLGYTTPEAAWLRGPARETIARLLAKPTTSFREFVQPKLVANAFEQFAAGAPIASGLIWRWINLDLWLHAFIDEPLRAGIRPFATIQELAK